MLDRIKSLQNAAKPATIYPALIFLIEQGLIHRVESLNAFVGCSCLGHLHEQLLLICSNCQEAEERSAPEVILTISMEIKQADFIVHSKTIEIHGAY